MGSQGNSLEDQKRRRSDSPLAGLVNSTRSWLAPFWSLIGGDLALFEPSRMTDWLMVTLTDPVDSKAKANSARRSEWMDPTHLAVKGPVGRNGELGCPAGTSRATRRAIRESDLPPAEMVRVKPWRGGASAASEMVGAPRRARRRRVNNPTRWSTEVTVEEADWPTSWCMMFFK